MHLLFTCLFALCLHFSPPAEIWAWLLPGSEPDCSGLNICLLSAEPVAFPAFPVLFTKSSRGVLHMRIRKKSLTDEQLLRFFSTGYFQMTTDFTVPAFVSQALGYSILIIRAGRYPITAAGGYYIIHM
jgi:hypothetical protein